MPRATLSTLARRVAAWASALLRVIGRPVATLCVIGYGGCKGTAAVSCSAMYLSE